MQTSNFKTGKKNKKKELLEKDLQELKGQRIIKR